MTLRIVATRFFLHDVNSSEYLPPRGESPYKHAVSATFDANSVSLKDAGSTITTTSRMAALGISGAVVVVVAVNVVPVVTDVTEMVVFVMLVEVKVVVVAEVDAVDVGEVVSVVVSSGQSNGETDATRSSTAVSVFAVSPHVPAFSWNTKPDSVQAREETDSCRARTYALRPEITLVQANLSLLTDRNPRGPVSNPSHSKLSLLARPQLISSAFISPTCFGQSTSCAGTR